MWKEDKRRLEDVENNERKEESDGRKEIKEGRKIMRGRNRKMAEERSRKAVGGRR